MSGRTNPAFRISKTDAGWSWATFDADGGLQGQGLAPSRQVAAFQVIRQFTQAVKAVRKAA